MTVIDRCIYYLHYVYFHKEIFEFVIAYIWCLIYSVLGEIKSGCKTDTVVLHGVTTCAEIHTRIYLKIFVGLCVLCFRCFACIYFVK